MKLKEFFQGFNKPVSRYLDTGDIIDIGEPKPILPKDDLDPMEQAFNDLFGPLLNGKSIFIEVNSRLPNPNIGPFFNNLRRWGQLNNLATVFIDFGYLKKRTAEENYDLFTKELKIITKQAKKEPVLLLIRRFNELSMEHCDFYTDSFLNLVSAKNPVGIIFETLDKSFIQSIQLTELGEVIPCVVDINKVISPRHSSYQER